MVGSDTLIQMQKTSVRTDFAQRLREELKERGFDAPRGARSGVDVRELMRITGVRSVETARKWVAGRSMPRTEPMKALADEWGLNVTWLRDGIGPKYPHQLAEREDTYNLSHQQVLVAKAWAALPTKPRACLEDLIFFLAHGDFAMGTPKKSRDKPR